MDCQVTTVCYEDGTSASTTEADPVIGMRIADADQRVAGKLVDLDPQQQMVSEIWGMIVRLTDGHANLLQGEYDVTPFTDIWPRAVSGGGGDMTMGAMYQSVIQSVTWGPPTRSRWLEKLKSACPESLLSIKFNVDGYNMSFGSPRFTLGRVVGTIGPGSTKEPRRFTLGRQLLPTMTAPSISSAISFMVCVVDEKRRKILANFGNALPTVSPGGALQDVGVLRLGTYDAAARRFTAIDSVRYRERGFYDARGGVEELPAGRDLTDGELAALSACQVAVAWGSQIVLLENLQGYHARADMFVFRMSPGDRAGVEIWASQFGKPLAGAQIVAFSNESGLSYGTDGTDDLGAPPPFATPLTALSFPTNVTTDAQGKAVLPLTASNMDTPRGYLDGQVYGVGYLPQPIYNALQSNSDGLFVSSNPSDFVSVLVWDSYVEPSAPTWYQDIQPITQQYANLYPIMGRIVDMGDYDSMVQHAKIVAMALSLPPSDPNYMPVTRDLSPAKRSTLLRWLTAPGKPLLGTPPAPKAAPPSPLAAVAAPAPPAADPPAVAEGSKSYAYRQRRRLVLPPGLGSSGKP